MLGYFQIEDTGYIKDVPVCAEYCDAWFQACKDDLTCVENWLEDFHFEVDVLLLQLEHLHQVDQCRCAPPGHQRLVQEAPYRTKEGLEGCNMEPHSHHTPLHPKVDHLSRVMDSDSNNKLLLFTYLDIQKSLEKMQKSIDEMFDFLKNFVSSEGNSNPSPSLFSSPASRSSRSGPTS